MVALHIWADASTDPELGIAFGAFIVADGKLTVCRLRAKTSTDAEFEIMTKAMKAAPPGCVMFTDLISWRETADRFNHRVLAEFKSMVYRKRAEVRYVAVDERSPQYHECHRVPSSGDRGVAQGQEEAAVQAVLTKGQRDEDSS